MLAVDLVTLALLAWYLRTNGIKLRLLRFFAASLMITAMIFTCALVRWKQLGADTSVFRTVVLGTTSFAAASVMVAGIVHRRGPTSRLYRWFAS